MVDEVQRDIAADRLYSSKRFTPAGVLCYPDLLLRAVAEGTAASLASDLRRADCFVLHEPRTRNGKTTMAAVPHTAPDTFAEGEFNRFYIRGVCRRSIDEGVGQVVVYRAKEVSSPRPESQAKLGSIVDAARLLEDLRENPGVDTALGLPQGPNSGLSVFQPVTTKGGVAPA